MRKKRRITKTTLLKKWFLLLAITAGLVTSCKNYDDDIDGLNEDVAALQTALTTAQTSLSTLQTQVAATATDSEVAAAVAAAKQQAIDAAAANVNALLTTLKGGYTGTLKDLNDDIVEVAGQLTALGVNVTALAADLDAAKVQIAANKTAIETQKAVLDKYLADGAPDNLVDAINAVKANLADLQASTVTDHEAMQAAIDDLQEQINAINGGLNVLDFVTAVNEMITNISFVYDTWTNVLMLQTLDYATAVAQKSWTFGGNDWDSKVVFTKGSRLLAEESVIYVKVTPANADLSKMVDKIYLLSSNDDGTNLLVNNYIKAKKAERWKDVLFTRAGETGLWAITFELPSTANIDDLADLTIHPVTGRPVSFAVGVENTVDDGESASERGVISEWGVTINVGDKEPIYNDQDDPNDLIFSVKNAADDTYTSYEDIRNRYAFTESGIQCKKDQRWAPGTWTTAETKEDDDVDDRTGEAFFGVEVNKAFNVRIDNADDVYAYYVVLDTEWAVESSPSEINAWDSYAPYEGLNKVYRSGEIANLKITKSAANGDIIGFRVYVVNYDGTLVDPDGKSFYVYVGDLMATALAFEQRVTSYVALGASVPSTVVNFTPGINLANVADATFTMTIGHGVVLGNANLQLLNSAGNILGTAATVTDWSSVAKLQIIGVLPSDLEENGKSYPGTLILKNAYGVSFSTTMITLKKVLPTFDANISYKTNIHHDVNGAQVVYAYPLPGTRYYNLGNALNGLPTTPELGSGFVVVNKSAYSAGSLPTWETAFTRGTVPVGEIGVPYLPSATEPSGHGKIYDLELTKDFGYVLYNQSAQCLIAWVPSPAIKAEFRSFVQDLVDWAFTGSSQADYPALKYATNLTGYSVGKITALPPAGARINLTQNEAGNLQDNRTFTIIDNVKLLTGANYATVNEYFTPAYDAATETISFTAVITSPPAGPVPTKLQITLQDDFGHRYTFTIPKIFNMVLN